MITWGLVSILTMFVQDVFQLNAVRILLGVAEAGFFPGIILYLTLVSRPRTSQGGRPVHGGHRLCRRVRQPAFGPNPSIPQ